MRLRALSLLVICSTAAAAAFAQKPPAKSKPPTPQTPPGGGANKPVAPPPKPAGGGTPITGPRWACPRPVYDFGETWQGTHVTYTFEIRNNGRDPLDILGIAPDCHCIVVSSHERRIPPGGVGRVPITLVTTGLGQIVTKNATIRLSDPAAPILRVTLQGTIKTVLTMTPPDLGLFGEIVGPNPAMTREADLTSNVPEPVKLELLKAPVRSPFDLQIKEVEQGKRWHLTLKTVPPLPVGYAQLPFQIKTDHPKLPVLTVTASVYHPAKIYARPPAVRLPDAAASQPFAVDVINTGKTPFKVLKVEIADEASIRTEVLPQGENFRIHLFMPAGYQLTTPRKMIVTTDDKDSPRVDVPIYNAIERPNPPPATNRSDAAGALTTQPVEPGGGAPQ